MRRLASAQLARGDSDGKGVAIFFATAGLFPAASSPLCAPTSVVT